MAKKINRKDRPMNAYVANIIKHGTPFTIRNSLYFETYRPRMGKVNGEVKVIGTIIQRVKARELSS